ncbi:hypothetical protein [Desulfosporosinus sp. OT]|uniref:hypothetical protein n=1 Tax=Desulfosporosinus sp. OT TaxID=913865 RepID=UPI0002239CE9|nr:hypothetical protein [Desulfosporosinus sp. OT]EGW39348.1 hypothetical protein DOT_2633 [Desulfosporosinus sp. OT]
MENKDTLRCEICGKTHKDTPIIEKPCRFGFRSKIIQLKQSTGDHRTQENICLECLQGEINHL